MPTIVSSISFPKNISFLSFERFSFWTYFCSLLLFDFLQTTRTYPPSPVWPEFGIKSSPTFSKVANIDTSVFYRKKSLDIWATFDRKFVDMNFRKSPNLVTLLPTTIVIIKELLLLWSMLYTFYQRKYRFGQIKTVSSDAWICIKYQAVVSLNQSGNRKLLTAFDTVLPS